MLREPLNIAMDARMVNASGIGTYIRGLLSALPSLLGATDQLSLIGRPEELPDWPVLPASAPIYSLREQWQVAEAFRRSRSRLLHVPHYNVPVLAAKRSVVTVHDLIHLRFPQFLTSPLALSYARFFLHRIVPRARAVLTVSEHSKRDIMEILGIPEGKITVSPHGVSERFHPRPPEEIAAGLAEDGLRPGYLLYVGNLKEFKNVPLLVATYEKLRGNRADFPPLVLVGRNFIRGFEQRLREISGIVWLPSVSQDRIPLLYCGARALVYPSLYEGFGLPPLEAMASGTPVICSHRASLSEVVGESALLIDPESVAELTGAIGRILADDALCDRLRALGLARAKSFTWRRTAEITLGVYRASS
jgi:glycosyltransferase involved in cell wall biosynthesis